MKAFIRATGNISPQKTFGYLLPGAPSPAMLVQKGNRLSCTEPDYLQYIDAKFIRRMSRIIKMGTAAAMECLQQAGVKNPDAIVMGTAYGCLEDTGIFLKKMVEQNEEMLTPTAFIQSTHNTIGAQIALLLQCHQYNNTFVHRGFSFESALLDALMLLEEGTANAVLAGAADEITDYSHAILSRFGLYKPSSVNNAALFTSPSKGSIAGEGAAFFLLSNQQGESDLARLDALTTVYKPVNAAEVKEAIVQLLQQQQLSIADIDLVITGRNGDSRGDKWYQALNEDLLSASPQATYKQLCGEYPTSTAFALWLAAVSLHQQAVPSMAAAPATGPLRRILIYNHYEQLHHSIMLVSAC
ncbi:MAG TPA: beta-ketoacyl synthase chain length factor [Chitinophagaceae bacterium]|nr:beta-ketoacyl synthase chain length factor [Chitinophagaceae bacterium]